MNHFASSKYSTEQSCRQIYLAPFPSIMQLLQTVFSPEQSSKVSSFLATKLFLGLTHDQTNFSLGYNQRPALETQKQVPIKKDNLERCFAALPCKIAQPLSWLS